MDNQAAPSDPTRSGQVPFREALAAHAKVAVNSFGGPAGQIAVMHRVYVEERGWVDENRFLHALNYCMFLPGPEAQQLATYIGWLLHRVRGGLVAGGLFVLPGFLAILVLSILYAGYRDLSWVQALFFGIKPAVLAIVLMAVAKIGSRALKNRVMVGLAALSFVGIFLLTVPFPLIIIGGAVIGLLGSRWWPDTFAVIRGHETSDRIDSSRIPRPTLGRTAGVLITGLGFWFIPLLIIGGMLGWGHIYAQEGTFFSKAAVVTFGGAYAVLAYIAQQAVEVYGWLQPGEMLDGLGMAETTPGPLIQVVQFVGFMGAYRNPGALEPMVAGTLASLLVTWVTFVPCFLWIFLGAPYIEALRANRTLSAALSGITAAVVGVVLNLAVWFGLHTLFAEVTEQWAGPIRLLVPVAGSLSPAAAVLAIGAFVALWRFRTGMIPTLLVCAGLGMAFRLAVPA